MNNKEVSKITEDSGLPTGQLSTVQVAAWIAEVDAQKKAESTWRKQAAKYTALYEGYKEEASPFNILFSNTDTLSPALYNNTPRPAVGRRFKDKDPLGAAVCLTLNRALSFTMDKNDGDDAEFDLLAEHAILQALVPGRGIVRYKYSADIVKAGGVDAASKATPAQIANSPAEGYAGQDTPEDVPMEKVENERVCGEMVQYDRFTCGYARKWQQVPWVSFEHHMTEEELVENFGEEIGKKVKCSELEEDENTEDGIKKDKRKVAIVYEIWNKADRTVMFVSPGLKDRELRIADDPLDLSGFYPMDEPLIFMPKVSSMIPQPIYNLYKKQAEELNQITNRITAVMECLKVRGAYDSSITEMSEILKKGDGEMVAIENVQMLGENADLKKAIFLMPLSELVSVLQQLYAQRQQIKTVIYEITGISDILRGSSVASETATAQTIKNDWGTLRLKKSQKKVQKWCRNNLRIMAEIMSKKFSKETFMRMTELPYITQERKQQAQMELQKFQAEQQNKVMQASMQPPQPGQPPAPPPQPEEPPEELKNVLATPVWEEIIQLMRDSIGMEFRVDIETNSTIADDMAEDQKNIGELLNALSQFLNGVAPLIENKTMPFEVAKAMMLGIVRKMVMGPEVEDLMDKMKEPEPPPPPAPPPPPPPDPNQQMKLEAEKAKLQLEMEKAKMDMQMLQMEMQMKQQELSGKMELERQKMEVNKVKFQQQMQLALQKAAQPKETISSTEGM